MAETRDYVEWLLPYLVGGICALLGALVLCRRRYAFADTWEVRGAAALLLGGLLMLLLPLTLFTNPTLDQRVAKRLEAKQRADDAKENQQRLHDVKAEISRTREQLKETELERE